jgi:hypothetical protein
MRRVGDYEWRQVSQWDFPPFPCIESYVAGWGAGQILHFYLRQVTEIVSDNQWKSEVVINPEFVPPEILDFRDGEVWHRSEDPRIKTKLRDAGEQTK